MSRPVSKIQTNIRPRFQREFFWWLGESKGEFAIRPHAIKRTDKEVEFGFAGSLPVFRSRCAHRN